MLRLLSWGIYSISHVSVLRVGLSCGLILVRVNWWRWNIYLFIYLFNSLPHIYIIIFVWIKEWMSSVHLNRAATFTIGAQPTEEKLDVIRWEVESRCWEVLSKSWRRGSWGVRYYVECCLSTVDHIWKLDQGTSIPLPVGWASWHFRFLPSVDGVFASLALY